MAQLNITLNQDEILQLLSSNREDAFKALLTECLNGVLQAESTAQLGAEPYERSETRSDSRNGTRERQLNTRIGTITLAVPRHREKPFHTLVFENYSRSEAALVTTMAEMVVNGVSTRKVATVMETLCGTSFSKSTVSEACKNLDKAVKDFKYRPLEGRYEFMYVDATYFKVRGEHRIGSKAMMVALAVTDNGKREIVGFEIYDNESKETWKLFLESLKDRGIKDPKLITSDAHDGILYAISKVFPNTPWQRCQTHFSRNILSHAPSKYQKAIHAELTELYNSTTIEEARTKRDSIIAEYSDVADKAMECLDNGFEDAMTVMALPECFRRYVRTSNHLERLNKELKRRSKVIGVFPNEGSLNRIIGSVLVELNDVYSLEHNWPISKKSMSHLDECTTSLILIAKEQQRLLAA
ncbi:MAG: IS256 family transposase [Butyrivibrio sp.]|nr:IS256 family transposase [Butyrivibrio sp.]